MQSANEMDFADQLIEDKCRVCTISSDCFTYFNIFEKCIVKNIFVYEALVVTTNLQVCNVQYALHLKHNSVLLGFQE